MRPIQVSGVLPAIFAATLVLGGCGDGGSTSTAADTRGVIASAADCVSFGPGAVDACAMAIERAVERHEANTITYTDREECEKAVGAGKCERSATGVYRPQLSAFRVTLGSSPQAEPLYPAKDGTVGFLTADKSPVLASDRNAGFSRLAQSVAEMQAGPQNKKRATKF